MHCYIVTEVIQTCNIIEIIITVYCTACTYVFHVLSRHFHFSIIRNKDYYLFLKLMFHTNNFYLVSSHRSHQDVNNREGRKLCDRINSFMDKK